MQVRDLLFLNRYTQQSPFVLHNMDNHILHFDLIQLLPIHGLHNISTTLFYQSHK